MQDQHCSDRQQTAARISKTSPRLSFRFQVNHLSRSDVGYRTPKLTRLVLLGQEVCGRKKKTPREEVWAQNTHKKKNRRKDKKDNGKEQNSSASLGKTRISRDFLFVADPAGPQAASDVGMKERR